MIKRMDSGRFFRHMDDLSLPDYIVLLFSLFLMMNCDMKSENKSWHEKQVTNGDYGHFINPVQAFSPDDQWIVYDTRNHGGAIGATGSVERVNLNSGEQEV